MHTRLLPVFFMSLITLAAFPGSAGAQTQPPPPPPGWAGSASAGIALTQGNSDTSTVNAAYELKRDTGSPIVITSSGLLVWGKSEGELTSDRLALAGRVERRLNARTSVFGQTQYLRDTFKAIDYLVSPTVGLSRMLFKDDRTELGVDGAVGVVWEQNPGLELQTDGAVTAGQQFARKLTATTELKQKVAALWKMDDFGDALYAFNIGLAASITAGTQLKVEFLDTYKTKPPSVDVQKNDIAILVSFVYKFE
jgi:putative salt-induced outer membrane protein YdiY